MSQVKRFNNIIFLVNPASTHIAQAMKRINELQKIYPQEAIILASTTAEGRDANIQILLGLSDKLGPDTLLCIAAGDGTTSMAIETLVQSKRLAVSARQTVVLPLWGGNANDLAHMLNGFHIAPLKHILDRSKLVEIYPLQFTLKYKSGRTVTRTAACYASFGASAFVAQRLNEFGHRHSTLHKLPGGRLVQEASTSWDALIKAPTFSILETGKYRSVYECTFSNGPRVGKVYRMPVKLNEQRFYLDIVQGNRGLVSGSKLFLSFLRRKSSDKLMRKEAAFTIQKATWAQFDGEAIEVPSGTKVEARLAKQPFYALSTRLGRR